MTYKQVLKACEVFSALNHDELGKVASLVLEKQYDAGTVLFREGDSADELLVLKEGKVAVQITLPEALEQMGRKITVDVVNRNEIVGWSALVEPYIYTLTGVCLQAVEVLSISGNEFRRLIRDDRSIDYKVLKQLIKVVASRLDNARQVLISERLFLAKTG